LRRSYGASRTAVQEKVALPIPAFSPRYRRLEVRPSEKASFFIAGFVEVAENEDFRCRGGPIRTEFRHSVHSFPQ
jgi:hypothetical protein